MVKPERNSWVNKEYFDAFNHSLKEYFENLMLASEKTIYREFFFLMNAHYTVISNLWRPLKVFKKNLFDYHISQPVLHVGDSECFSVKFIVMPARLRCRVFNFKINRFSGKKLIFDCNKLFSLQTESSALLNGDNYNLIAYKTRIW